jgi:hypothetical protein
LRQQAANGRAILLEFFGQPTEERSVMRVVLPRGQATDDVNGAVGAAEVVTKIGDECVTLLCRRT